MRRYLRGIVVPMTLGVVIAVSLIAQEPAEIGLDSGLRSEILQMHYFLAGKFGGYGGFKEGTPAVSGRMSLPLYRGGERATSVKTVVYLKGCELATFVLDPIPQDPRPLRFECRELDTVWLRGVVLGHPRPWELTVRLRYVAEWSHKFFGISDGPVVSLAIAEAVPDRDGKFAVELPDFANDRVTKFYYKQAHWSVTALEPGSNDQYWLRTGKERDRVPGTLTIESEYPGEFQFVAEVF